MHTRVICRWIKTGRCHNYTICHPWPPAADVFLRPGLASSSSSSAAAAAGQEKSSRKTLAWVTFSAWQPPLSAAAMPPSRSTACSARPPGTAAPSSAMRALRRSPDMPEMERRRQGRLPMKRPRGRASIKPRIHVQQLVSFFLKRKGRLKDSAKGYDG